MRQLETPRLILRPFREEDAADVFDYARDPRVGPWAGWPVHKSVEESREIIKTVFTKPWDLAIVDRESGRVIGSGGLTDRHRDILPGANDEIGCVLHPAWWGRGLAPEAMGAVIRHAFEGLGLDHLWYGYYDGNAKSDRLREKLGFLPWGEPAWVEVPLLGEKRLEHWNLLTRQRWQEREKGGGGL